MRIIIRFFTLIMILCAVLVICGNGDAYATDNAPAEVMLESIKDALNESIFDKMAQVLLAVFVITLLAILGRLMYSSHQRRQKNLLLQGMKKLKEEQERQREKALTSNQKRMWIRVMVHEPVYFYDPLGKRPKNIDEYEKGVILDISGGGLLVATNRVLAPDGVISLMLELSGKHLEDIKARVVRERICSGEFLYAYAMEFTLIKEAQRDLIIKWVFDQERQEICMEKQEDESKPASFCEMCGVYLTPAETLFKKCKDCQEAEGKFGHSQITTKEDSK